MESTPGGEASAQPPAPASSTATQAPAVSRAAEQAVSSYRWVIVAMLSSIPPINSFVALSFGVLLPYIRDDIQISNSQAGLISGAAWMAPIVLAIPAGLLSARLPPKWTFTFMLTGIGGVLVMHSLATAFLVLLLARFLYSIASSFFLPNVTVFRTQWIPKHEMGFVAGLQGAAQNAGQSLSLLAVPLLIEALDGWRRLFLLYAAIVGVLVILWIIFGKERRSQEFVEDLAKETAPARPKPTQAFLDFIRPLGGFFRYREFALSTLANWGNIIPFVAMATFWPTFLIEERGFARNQAAMLMSLVPLGGICGSLLPGYLSDRVGLRRPFIWPIGLVSPLVYIAMLQGLPIAALAPLAFIVGYLTFAWLPPWQATLYELPGIKTKQLLGGSAISQTFSGSSFAFAPLLVGLLADGPAGSLRVALMLSTFGPLGVVVAGSLARETGRRRPAKPSP